MPEFIGFQTVVILDLYEKSHFHAAAILSHWPWIFTYVVHPQRTVLAPVRTSEEPVRQVPRTTIRPTLIQIILADSIIVKFEVGVGGGWRRDRGGASVFSCKLSSSKNQSSEVAMWRLYRRWNFALIFEPHAAAAKLRTLGWAKQDLLGLGGEP
jgi:hypothetical protein